MFEILVWSGLIVKIGETAPVHGPKDDGQEITPVVRPNLDLPWYKVYSLNYNPEYGDGYECRRKKSSKIPFAS